MPKRRRGIKLKPTDLKPAELALTELPAELKRLATTVSEDGGAVLASYREPLGGHALLLVALPIDKVAPTPFQRDVSDSHVRKLEKAMDKTKRFLDPVIVVRAERDLGEGEAGAFRYTLGCLHHAGPLSPLQADRERSPSGRE